MKLEHIFPKEKDKLFSVAWFKTYGTLILGCFALSIGYSLFMTPYKIVPGGIYGIATILHYNYGFPIGMAALCFNLPLSLWGIKKLGKGFGFKTFLAFILIAFFADSLSFLGPDPLKLQDDVLLACIFGGVIMGVGVGLILSTGASSGGTDVLSSILNKMFGKEVGFYQMVVDGIIVVGGLLVFQDWKIPFYSWFTIFLMSKVIDMVLKGGSRDKSFFIISDKADKIKDFIINDLSRSGSVVPVKGMYTNKEKEMIVTIVRPNEVIPLRNAIQEIDPEAFSVMMDAREIWQHGNIRLK